MESKLSLLLKRKKRKQLKLYSARTWPERAGLGYVLLGS